MITVPIVPNHSSNHGFSLIELLVTVAISLVVVGGGIAAMVTFNNRQAVQNAAKNLQTTIRGAQSRARLGDLPEECYDAGEPLTGYRVTLTDGSPVVTTQAVCDTLLVTTDTLTLPNQVISRTTAAITFGSVYGGIEGATDITLESGTVTSLQYAFTVTAEGEITEGSLQ